MQQPGPDPDRGVYGISVAAELVGMGTQNLRLYESRGLLEPDRSSGGTRRYSDNDLDRLRRIGQLLDEGLNLAGIAAVLGLEAENAELQAENVVLQAETVEYERTQSTRTGRRRGSDQQRRRSGPAPSSKS